MKIPIFQVINVSLSFDWAKTLWELCGLLGGKPLNEKRWQRVVQFVRLENLTAL